ncbi:hypothetical protein SARC_11579 [Sphaeroforma arctica JP610]|uniref:Uncharacterized protein n=1 Tax=Sphaeroforma arctica JP610 TaxID=667725 RepID=A0A0L0FGJ4_9EUKA|nr:hypothetical protein SARC_11579 [Sphaeroforma arctica JP610]KNC75904.1 hypothetical protein SARC_11579 [Sphaeroforma arctica JP610]|eukprot:XP_014149806.1 hypothetical protein SARC_11579 [Sphaeroforma arctica JP610]
MEDECWEQRVTERAVAREPRAGVSWKSKRATTTRPGISLRHDCLCRDNADASTQRNRARRRRYRVDDNNICRQNNAIYDRRLQRLQRAKSPSPNSIEFRIRGADQTRHGVGYTSSDQEEDDTRQEPLSLQSFAQEQQRATQNPHGREALDIHRDNMETSLQAQRQGQQFVQNAMGDSLMARRMLERTPSSSSTDHTSYSGQYSGLPPGLACPEKSYVVQWRRTICGQNTST